MRTPLSIFGCGILLLVCGAVHAQPQQSLYGICVECDALIRIDPETGAGTAIGPLGFGILTAGADFACDGNLWGFSQLAENPSTHALYRVDLTTGAGTIVRVFDTSPYDPGVGFEFGADEGTFYWWDGKYLKLLDPITGVITPVAWFSDVERSYSFTVAPDCSGDFLVAQSTGTWSQPEPLILTRIDASGSQSMIGDTGLLSPPRFTSLASSPDGRVFAHYNGSLYEVDVDTGAATLIGPIGAFQIAGMAAGPEEVTCAECPFECPPVLDFETDGEGLTLTAGQVIDDEFAALGIMVTTDDPSNHPAMIFDSANPTCNDEDLGTPNEDFFGPGVGSGGEAGQPGRNGLPRGNVLILSESDDCVPNDKAGGGIIEFLFDEPVPLVTEVHILDVEASEAGETFAFATGLDETPDDGSDGGSCEAAVRAWDEEGNLIPTRVPPLSAAIPLLGLGNNSFQVVPVGATDVARLEVELCGSGAISAIVFCTDCGANFGGAAPNSLASFTGGRGLSCMSRWGCN